MNIKTGKVTNLEINFHYYESLSVKTCPISLIGDKVYVIYSKKSGNLINWDFFELTLKDLENIDGPNIVRGFYLYYSMNSEPICYEKQIACETISISNENGIYLVCLYVKPEKQKDNNETIYNIYGIVEKKNFFIFDSILETEIRLEKIDSYTLSCILIDRKREIKIEKINGTISIYNN